MIFWKGNRRYKQTCRQSIMSAQGFVNAQGIILNWAVVGAVSLVLGVYAIIAPTLSRQWMVLSLAAVMFPFIVMIVGNVRRLLLAAILLDIPFQMDVYLFYREDTAQFGALGGLMVSVTTMALAILYALWFVERLTKAPEPRSRSLFRTSLPLGLYVAFGLLSMLAAQDIELSIFQIFFLGQMCLLYIYVVGTVKSRQDIVFIITILLIGLVLESLIMIGLKIIGYNIKIGIIKAVIDGNRVSGTLTAPNIASSYLSLTLAPAMGIILTRLDQKYKWLAVIAFGLGVIALFLTLSRGGWVTLVLSVAILCLLAWHRGWLSPTIPIAIVIIAILVAILFQQALMDRIFGDDGGSAHSRVPLMKIAFRIISDNPLLGVGINNYAIAMRPYLILESANVWLFTVHNKYLLTFAEIGTGGVIAYIWFLLATIRRGWQCWAFGDRLLSPLALGFAAAIAGQMIHMNVDIFNARPQVQLLWLVAGLITAMHHLASEGPVMSPNTGQSKGHDMQVVQNKAVL